MTDFIPVQRALISVSDKTDLVPFAKRLTALGVAIISTGGTARTLQDAGIPVTPIDQVTGFPEMMDGRVKTLHPKIHGGLLALRDHPQHVAAMQQHGIAPIDLVCVNLYPFEKTIVRPGVSDEEAIEQIDIGGPSMIRSAAKNHRFVAVVTDPTQYDRVCSDLEAHHGATSTIVRQWLAAAAFARTAAYDTAIAAWMHKWQAPAPGSASASHFPDPLVLRYQKHSELRYGENPHQAGALYLEPGVSEPCVARATQLHGKALSFCNLFDADGALELVKEIDPASHAAAAVIKHANPCGFAIAADLPTAFQKAYDGDPLAAFGGIIAFNRRVDHPTAQRIVAVKHLLEVIIAPGYDPDALTLLRERWKNVRLLEIGALTSPNLRPKGLAYRQILGGLLAQDRDLASYNASDWQHVAGPQPTADDLRQLQLALIAVKHLKSNAICIVQDDMLVGAGAGQMDRLASCALAVSKAGARAQNGYAASDAFFPFRDGPDTLIKAGVKAIVQPGGAVRDVDSIAACNEAHVTMLFSGRRHFRH